MCSLSFFILIFIQTALLLFLINSGYKIVVASDLELIQHIERCGKPGFLPGRILTVGILLLVYWIEYVYWWFGTDIGATILEVIIIYEVFAIIILFTFNERIVEWLRHTDSRNFIYLKIPSALETLFFVILLFTPFV